MPLLEMINIILGLVGLLSVIGMIISPIFAIVCLVLLVLSSKEQELVKKKMLKKWSIICLIVTLLPIIVLIGVMIVWSILSFAISAGI